MRLPLLWKRINWIQARAELRLRTVEITLNHRNRLVLTREAIAFPDPSLTLPDLREKLIRRRSEAPSFSSSQLVYLNAPSISTSKKIPGWPWKYLSVLVCTLDAFFDFLHRLYLLSPLFLSWIAESLIIVCDPRFSSSPALSRSSPFVNVSSDVSFAPNPLRLYPTNMRFNIVLLLGLVSATYALPNPGLRHFQPRSDTEADAQRAVGNHTFGLTRRGESSAARTSNPAEGSAGTTAPYFVKGLASRPGYNILASNDPSRGITLMIQANPEYAAELAVWSVQVISRIFEPHEVFPHLLLFDMELPPVPPPVPIHEPHHWYYEIMNKDMAVVINKATAQLVGWMPVAEASSLHDSNLVVVKTPVIGSISVLAPLDRVKVQGAFCDNQRREIVGTSFSMPERKPFMQLRGMSDREIMETFQTLSRGSLDQTHS
ncbi:hypothetical protein FB446DRAFT_100227 [Lentinula raphanica]|nr:hypothetical protein FB446DRAFT_100227 [Lentinula raphanica]